MEMNTRLQVEHPVTEAVLGSIWSNGSFGWPSASGCPGPPPRRGPRPRGRGPGLRGGPRRGFLPAAGTVRRLTEPADRPHVRVDSALREGTVVGTDYDPMLAKIVAWGADRSAALDRLPAALAATHVLGVTTNVGFLRRLVATPMWWPAGSTPSLVERIAPALADPPAPPKWWPPPPCSRVCWRRPLGPWSTLGTSRMAGGRPVRRRSPPSGWWTARSSTPAAWAPGPSGSGRPHRRRPGPAGRPRPSSSRSTAAPARYAFATFGDAFWLGCDGDAWALTRLRETIDRTGPARHGAGPLTSPMPGTVLAVYAARGHGPRRPGPGDGRGHENGARGGRSADGTVSEILVKAGQAVALDQPLAVVHATGRTREQLRPRAHPRRDLPERVDIYEVGARDGLQNEPAILPAATKAEFISRLVGRRAAHRRGHQLRVPQVGAAARRRRGPFPDAGATPRRPLPGPGPEPGWARTGPRRRRPGHRRVRLATESFAQRNLNRTLDESLDMFAPVVACSRQDGMWVRAYISMCFGDPWEGDVPVPRWSMSPIVWWPWAASRSVSATPSAWPPRARGRSARRPGRRRHPHLGGGRALPRHLRPGPGQHPGRPGSRRHDRRRLCRRPGRLPVRRERHRQPGHRGPGVAAARPRHRHRRRPGHPGRDQRLDGRAAGRPSPSRVVQALSREGAG